ncbi:TetR/AcrR family transcriptional regulator [Ornithinimicrobium faecis]|uniref:TetR/AcrR family transcriptional regulator n=1 Tax=Ornithinimicrobium faecis TaxID=2934158 RepID=A0ABY4YVL7_9MICO|nr:MULTISPECIES: TetR/AcrR family transcriptional regulator [unclassified Ornithinimicrobium]USQ80520.1 TetR/AcrR family transcriptional regulator [Ornithinimicrobium sp. HY1793]
MAKAATAKAPAEPGARERNRAEVMAQIMAAGRRELTEHGADGLSLRAVAREIGMVSSAVYRYVASRDELLTLLIVESYDSIGLAAERAAAKDGSAVERFVAIAHAVRDWARKHPQEYTLLHGSPVPGYSAPQDTIVSGTRVPAAMIGLLIEEHAAGRVAPPDPKAPPISPALAAQCESVREFFGGVDLPDELVLRGIAAWTQVYGLITFELFGQLQSTFEPADELMGHQFSLAAARIGL